MTRWHEFGAHSSFWKVVVMSSHLGCVCTENINSHTSCMWKYDWCPKLLWVRVAWPWSTTWGIRVPSFIPLPTQILKFSLSAVWNISPMCTVTVSDQLININYTLYLGKNVIRYCANMLGKYHWFPVNFFWPPGLRLSVCDVHNSLNTDPLLLLSIWGQTCGVKSKIISSPINNQLQDCCPNDSLGDRKSVV